MWQHRLSKLVSRVEAGVSSVSRVMAIIAAGVLGIMMLLTTTDVMGRYFFNHPLKWSYELVGLMMCCAVTWGLAYCEIHNGHIRVTILLDRFPPRLRAIVNSLAYIIGLGGFSLICWQTAVLAKAYILLPKGGLTTVLGIPFTPFMFMLAIGAGMLAVQLLIRLLHSLAQVVQ